MWLFTRVISDYVHNIQVGGYLPFPNRKSLPMHLFIAEKSSTCRKWLIIRKKKMLKLTTDSTDACDKYCHDKSDTILCVDFHGARRHKVISCHDVSLTRFGLIILHVHGTWYHRCKPALIQVMTWFLMAPSHCLNECWHVINEEYLEHTITMDIGKKS